MIFYAWKSNTYVQLIHANQETAHGCDENDLLFEKGNVFKRKRVKTKSNLNSKVDQKVNIEYILEY